MLWIILTLFVALIYSISAFIDNYAIDVIFANKKPQCMKVMNGICYCIIALIGLGIFGPGNYSWAEFAIIFLAGTIASLASMPYYAGLKTEDATNAAIFYQLSPVLFLVAEAVLFGEKILPLQYIAFFTILAAPITVLLLRKKNNVKIKKNGAIYFSLYVIILTISAIIFSRVAKSESAINAYIIYLFGKAFFDMFASTIMKSWRKDFIETWNRKKTSIALFCGANMVIFVVAECIYRYCMTVVSGSLVSVMLNASELVLTFALGIVLSKIWPNFGREDLDRRTIIAHLIATILATVGIVILNL